MHRASSDWDDSVRRPAASALHSTALLSERCNFTRPETVAADCWLRADKTGLCCARNENLFGRALQDRYVSSVLPREKGSIILLLLAEGSSKHRERDSSVLSREKGGIILLQARFAYGPALRNRIHELGV